MTEDTRYRTDHNRKKDLIRWNKELRTRRKLKAIEIMGGSCKICGYNKCPAALEFHHIDTKNKLFCINEKTLSNGWNKILLELEKCVLVCCRCHREIHMKVIDISSSC